MPNQRRSPLVEEKLTHSIIGAFYHVHRELGFGFLERVYAAAMEIELKRRGHNVQREVCIQIRSALWPKCTFLSSPLPELPQAVVASAQLGLT